MKSARLNPKNPQGDYLLRPTYLVHECSDDKRGGKCEDSDDDSFHSECERAMVVWYASHHHHLVRDSSQRSNHRRQNDQNDKIIKVLAITLAFPGGRIVVY